LIRQLLSQEDLRWSVAVLAKRVQEEQEIVHLILFPRIFELFVFLLDIIFLADVDLLRLEVVGLNRAMLTLVLDVMVDELVPGSKLYLVDEVLLSLLEAHF